MRSAPERDSAANAGSPEEPPALPGFRTWRGVYWFVLAVFALVVIGLTVFSRVFA